MQQVNIIRGITILKTLADDCVSMKLSVLLNNFFDFPLANFKELHTFPFGGEFAAFHF